MKKVAVSIIGSGQLLDRTIEPGTTAGDVLRGVNLENGLLSPSGQGDFFANSDSIYEKVSDGQKLFASTPASVGASFLQRLANKAAEALNDRYSFQSSRYPSITGGAVRRPAAPVVARRQVPYWQERGWKREANTYSGKYITPYGAYTGWVTARSPQDIEFYIQHPPACILNSSHAACFLPRGEAEWFFVHMSIRPKDVSSGINTIERLIGDCFRDER
jgi:hypothetical protein